MRPSAVRRVWLVVVTVLAAMLVLPPATAWACSCAQPSAARSVQAADIVLLGTIDGAAVQGSDPGAGDTAWLVPLIGGSVLALLLGAALVLVLLRGRRR